MRPPHSSKLSLRALNSELRGRLEESEDIIRAIRGGDIDALVIQSTAGPKVYTLEGHDAETNRIRGEMLAQVSDAVIAVNLDSHVIYLNSAAEKLYGVTASKGLGRPLGDLFETRWPSPADEKAATRALAERGDWRGENVHVRQDGRALDVESSITALRDRDDRVSGVLAVIRDITERKLYENKVTISEIRYRRLFETAHDGVLIIDPATRRIIDANPFMTRMLGYPQEQLLGKELFEIGLLKDTQESRNMIGALQRSHQVRYENLPLRTLSGRRQEVEVVANLYEENGRAVIQCNIRDITERKLAEEHVQLLMAEVNHRAKNLLAVVQAVAHQTAKYGDPATFVARLTDRIDGLAAGQDLLVKNHWRGVEVADLVEAQLSPFKDLMGERIIMDGPSSVLNAAAAQGIGMALHELTTNAVKYGALSNTKGRVHISWRITPTVKPIFSISWIESHGPPVPLPTRKGFGQIIIGRMAEAAVGGRVEVTFQETGVAWRLEAPAEYALTTVGEEVVGSHDTH